MICVVDYDAGNLRSVETALAHLGADFTVSPDPDVLRSADKIIFPGVGEAEHAMGVLRQRGLDSALREALAGGVPVLGICIASQILLEASDESKMEETVCLGIEKGRARFFAGDFQRNGISSLKVPHMGWNQVCINESHPSSKLFQGIPQNASFFFVHSYYPAPEDRQVTLGTTNYGMDFVSAYGRDNLLACQFHPEKSGPCGLKLLSNFLDTF